MHRLLFVVYGREATRISGNHEWLTSNVIAWCTQPLGANHFAIQVDDIDAVTDLQEQGVEVHRILFILGAGHQAFLHDPFGNLLELNQPE
jgi:catechol 2,3-dioxygenase-like lactoylglutathione lyase family enzyme